MVRVPLFLSPTALSASQRPIYSVPCDWILQRDYYEAKLEFTEGLEV